jgi:hypothetical protein
MDSVLDESEAPGLLSESRLLPIAQVVQERDELVFRQSLAAAELEWPGVDPRGPFGLLAPEAHVDESREPEGVVDEETSAAEEDNGEEREREDNDAQAASRVLSALLASQEFPVRS